MPAYQWPAFAQQWGLHLLPFESRPHIVPVGDGHVRDWQHALTEHIDWPSQGRFRFSTAEVLHMKMMVVRPFAQILMLLQHDYILFRRMTLETLQNALDAQQRMDATLGTLVHNDQHKHVAIEAHNLQLDSQRNQLG